MKIALFTDTYVQPNGVAVHVKQLASTLSKKKHKVTVYTGSGHSSKYKIVNLPHVKYPLAPEYEIIFPKTMKIDSDITHVHSPYFTYKMAVRSGLPIVSTTHTSPAQMLAMYKALFLEKIGWKFLVRFNNKSDHVI